LIARTNDATAEYNSLNGDQRRVVDKVMSSVCGDGPPIRLIVSGQGGTGKSRVIDILNQLVSRKIQSPNQASILPVVVCAPTGLAAFNVGGATIHHTLSLPVEHGKPANYSALSQDQIVTLRATLRGLRLLIIDEVSMVSSLTLLFIHLRLTEVMSCNELFGGISIIFFADLLQLPPVKGNQPFVPVTFFEAKQRLGAVASMDLWKTFQYDELTINMRQSGDKQYAELLSNIRVGRITDDQHSMLTQRLIANGRRATIDEISATYQSLTNSGQNPIILMPTLSLCQEVNTAMMNTIGNDLLDLTAVDTLDTIIDQKNAFKG